MNIVEWIEQNTYHTSLCDKHRRNTLGRECVCGRDECIFAIKKLLQAVNKQKKDGERSDIYKQVSQIVKHHNNSRNI